MGLRPNRCYRDLDRPYTRYATRVQRKDFIGSVPGVRTRQFVLGNQTKDFGYVLDIVADKAVQVRDNALEATRLKLVRELNKRIGKDNWTLKIRKYPFHILRENKAATGTSADRVSTGMKHAFGKTIGRAVQMKKSDILLSLVIDEQYIDIGKEILKKIRHKINMPYHIAISKHENKRLSGRKKWTREAKIAKAKAIEEADKAKAKK